MTVIPQLRKRAIRKRASHLSSVGEPDIDFRKLVDKLEQAENTRKLEETESLKLQYVNYVETTTSQIKIVHDSDTELAKKLLKLYTSTRKKMKFQKWCNYCRRYGHSFAECRQKQQDNQNEPQKYREPNKSF